MSGLNCEGIAVLFVVPKIPTRVCRRKSARCFAKFVLDSVVSGCDEVRPFYTGLADSAGRTSGLDSAAGLRPAKSRSMT